jgi:hypothetical protein
MYGYSKAMTAKRSPVQVLSERVSAIGCTVRGHRWAGARQHAAQSDGLLLCLRCGFEDAAVVGAGTPTAQVGAHQ